MTTKDWQSEVEAAAEDHWMRVLGNSEIADGRWDWFHIGWRACASWAREKLEKKKECSVELSCDGGIWECQKEQLEERITDLERTEKVYLMNREWIEAAKERERKLVEALEFYANKENWTIQEDYDGYVNGGFIISEDIEQPDKIPNTWNGYEFGGKTARAALKAWRGEE